MPKNDRFLSVYIGGTLCNTFFSDWDFRRVLHHCGIQGLGYRTDLSVKLYEDCVRKWIGQGANVVGGCCQIGVEYIEKLKEVRDE